MERNFANPEFRAATEAARLAGWLAERARHPRCCALRADGEPCRHLALPGRDRCHIHGGVGTNRRRRATVKGEANTSRAHERRLSCAWAVSPWCPGWTVELPPDVEADMQERLRAEGLRLDWISSQVADWLRWRVVQARRRGRLDADWGRLVDELRRRDAATGDAPEGIELPDFSEASRAYCWRPRLTLKPGSKVASAHPGHRRTASPAQLAARDQAIREAAQEWKPQIGGRLTPTEREQLARATARDGHQGGGTAHMDRVQAAIEAWRRVAAERQPVEPVRPVDPVALDVQLEVAARVRAERRGFEVGEDGQVVERRPARARSARTDGW